MARTHGTGTLSKAVTCIYVKVGIVTRSAWTTSDTFPSPRFRVWAANGCPQSRFAHRASLIRAF